MATSEDHDQRFLTIEQSVEQLRWEVGKIKGTSDRVAKSNEEMVQQVSKLNSQFEAQSQMLTTIAHTLDRLDPTNREIRSLEKAIATTSDTPNQVLTLTSDMTRSELQSGYRGISGVLANRESLLRKVDLPVFNGSLPFGWIARAERFFRLGDYSDDQKLDLVSVSLDGPGLSWFNWEVEHEIFRNWLDFKQRMLDRFGESLDFQRLEEESSDTAAMLETKSKKLMCHTCSVAALEIPGSMTVHESQGEQHGVSHPQQIDSSTLADLHAASWNYSSDTMDQLQPPIGFVINDLHSSFGMDTLSVLSGEQLHVLPVAEEDALQSDPKRFIGKHDVYQVFDGFFLRQHRFQQRKKLSLSPKSWMFKFKNMRLPRSRSSNNLQQLIHRTNLRYTYSCSSAQVGSKWKGNNFTYWRRRRQTHRPRFLCKLRLKMSIQRFLGFTELGLMLWELVTKVHFPDRNKFKPTVMTLMHQIQRWKQKIQSVLEGNELLLLKVKIHLTNVQHILQKTSDTSSLEMAHQVGAMLQRDSLLIPIAETLLQMHLYKEQQVLKTGRYIEFVGVNYRGYIVQFLHFITWRDLRQGSSSVWHRWRHKLEDKLHFKAGGIDKVTQVKYEVEQSKSKDSSAELASGSEASDSFKGFANEESH